MNHANVPLVLVVALLSACANSPQPESTSDAAALPIAETKLNEAMLLVSLDDGTVIMQTIDSPASICFKLNSETATTCLSQGAPLVDPTTDTVIGYEMIEERIDLYAKSD